MRSYQSRVDAQSKMLGIYVKTQRYREKTTWVYRQTLQ